VSGATAQAPVVVVVTGPAGPATADWRGALRARLGDAQLVADGVPEAQDLDALARAFPARAVLLLRAGLELPEAFGEALAAAIGVCGEHGPVVFPGNYHPGVDPLAGLDCGSLDRDRALFWCGDRRLEPLDTPPSDCLLLPPGAVAGQAAGLQVPRAWLFDHGYVTDPAAPAIGAPSDVALLGASRARVEGLLAEGLEALPALPRAPMTLHVTHSWGGGVWRWIEDFIAADADHVHLVLSADSDAAGNICGRSLRLGVAGPGRGVIGEYALAPPIAALADRHAGYREHLQAVLARFEIGRIIVSSPIGHSLEALRTGLPTVQVLHDFFPLWPLLDLDPVPWLDAAGGDPDRARRSGLAADTPGTRLAPPRADAWNGLASAWQAAVAEHGVRLVAPTRHVAARWRALAGNGLPDIEIVGHGLRPFAAAPPEIRCADTERRLHLVVPGRLTQGKGRALLEAALPELAPVARFTLLGCGRPGFALFGRGDVDIVPNYAREDLPRLIDMLRPDAALLLSTVPETWSYALSEMRALGLAPIATRVGSFPERIREGIDGFVFDPDAGSLVACVKSLAQARARLREAAANAPAERSPEDVVAALDRLLAASPPAASGRVAPPRPASAAEITHARQAAALADARRRFDEAADERRALQAELERRSAWAETMERQFRARSAWATRLDEELAEARGRVERETSRAARLEAEHQRLEAEHQRLEAEHQRLEAEHAELRARVDGLAAERDALQVQAQALEGQLEEIMHSRSWRLTRPLRVARRLVSRQRLKHLAQPWRWPGMLAVLAHHLRLRGLRGALEVLQHQAPPVAEPETVRPTPAPRPAEIAGPVTHLVPEAPDFSVIVPVYNQLHFTAGCLESLVSVRVEASFEIIVVDDASRDATPDWLKRCGGISVVRNRRNRGFIRTCNRGAERARGRWLVFLNNDTRVTDGWLDALARTLRAGAGIVGARLVFGDGLLQEAGGIVFRDASGWNFGRGEHPDRPEFSFVSEADYVSGACLAIPAGLFAELGGFDRHFAPAYYEDTDLCFRVRARGLKVIYQPAATVFHFEGGTSGTDETAGAKRHQVVNRDRFAARWRDTLAAYPENPGRYSASVARALRYRRLPRRALVIDAVTPMPDHDSGSVRMFALLELLVELGFHTSFMPHNLCWNGRHSSELQQAGIEVLTAPWLDDPEDWLAEHGASVDLVIVSRHYVLAPLRRLILALCPNARLVFDTVDLHFLREQREAELAGTGPAQALAAKTRAVELDLVDAADATLVVSEFERALLADLKPRARVRVVSNIHRLGDPGRPFDQRRDLVFVGGFQHPPNVDAAEWLIDGILPAIRQALPEIQLHLIGSRMPDRLRERRAPGLKVHGFVADLAPFLSGCRISVAPLRYGAGVKGKVNQAMSHGLPVVATSCAAEGIHAEHGRDVLIADDTQAFAAEVVRLYSDARLWRRLAEHGRANVERHFSVDAARRALSGLLRELDFPVAGPGPGGQAGPTGQSR